MDLTPRILMRMLQDLRQSFPGVDVQSTFNFREKRYLIKMRLGPTTLYYTPDPKAFEEGYEKEKFLAEVKDNFEYHVDAWEDNKKDNEEQELV